MTVQNAAATETVVRRASVFPGANPVRPCRAVGFALLLATAAALPLGCSSKGVEPGADSEKGQLTAAEEAAERCDDLMNSVLDIFQLEKLGISSDIDSGISMLNQMEQYCGVAAPAAPATRGSDALVKTEWRSQIDNPRFARRDGVHLRDNVLFKAVNNFAVGQADNEPMRVLNVFQHVVRTVRLRNDVTRELPLTPYELYLLGQGTPADRAWVFSHMLRQLKIDAVLLFPQTAAGQPLETPLSERRFLIGVLLDDEVYLFDPWLGLPVRSLPTAGAGNAAGQTLATLQQAAADPAVLQQFDLDDLPYPIAAADLQKPLVAIIGDTALWSTRMQRLQPRFSGQNALIVSDPLDDSATGPGAISRVRAAGGAFWNAESLLLWEYPETQLAGYQAMTQEQRQIYQRLVLPWSAPIPVTYNAEAKRIEFQKPSGKLFEMRLTHAAGDFEEAVVGYTAVRLDSMGAMNRPGGPVFPAELHDLHERANDQASYWLGVCQLDQGNQRLAQETFRKYLQVSRRGLLKGLMKVAYESSDEVLDKAAMKSLQTALDEVLNEALAGTADVADDVTFAKAVWQATQAQAKTATIPGVQKVLQGLTEESIEQIQRNRDGAVHWAGPSRHLLAVSLADDGQYAEAIAALQGVGTEDPESAGYRLQIRVWESQLKTAGGAKADEASK